MNFIFCNTLCIHPKFNDSEYLKYSPQIENEIESYLQKIGKSNPTDQDIKYTNFLSSILYTLSNNQNLRASIIKLRNELILFKDPNILSADRMKIINLTIQVLMLCYNATFYCTSANNFDKKLDKLKVEFEYFKKLIKDNKNNFNQTDKFYLSILYKIPKLMRIKRGYKKVVNK